MVVNCINLPSPLPRELPRRYLRSFFDLSRRLCRQVRDESHHGLTRKFDEHVVVLKNYDRRSLEVCLATIDERRGDRGQPEVGSPPGGLATGYGLQLVRSTKGIWVGTHSGSKSRGYKRYDALRRKGFQPEAQHGESVFQALHLCPVGGQHNVQRARLPLVVCGVQDLHHLLHHREL